MTGAIELAKEMLRRAIDLAVETPRAMGCDARDGNGKLCHVASADAEQFSILGVVFRAACGMGFKPDAAPKENGDLFTACRLACMTLNQCSLMRYGRTIQDLNDDRKTTQLAVIYVLMKAMEYVEELQQTAIREDA